MTLDAAVAMPGVAIGCRDPLFGGGWQRAFEQYAVLNTVIGRLAIGIRCRAVGVRSDTALDRDGASRIQKLDAIRKMCA